MTNNYLGSIFFKKVGKLRPTFFGLNQNTGSINFNGVYLSYTNWSHAYRHAMFSSNLSSRNIGFRSGSGTFLSNNSLLIDALSEQILTIMVRDSEGRLFYLVSDKLDTPKCIRRYKSFRSHWRRGLFTYYDTAHANRNNKRKINLISGIKIVKTNHEFLQKFILKFNKVPTAKEMIRLKTLIGTNVHRAVII